MKKGMTLFCLLICLQGLQAQTWSEWFKQKKTQIKYLTQQIVALKVYAEILGKGYAIAKDGLTVINDIKQGDFDLHNTYFKSLKTVSLTVKDQDKLSATFRLRNLIEQQRDKILKVANSSSSFDSAELDYIKRVIANLTDMADEDLDQVQLLIEDGKLELKHDERWKRIDQVYKEMEDKYSFIKYFSNDVQKLSIQRKREQVELLRMKSQYGQ